MSTKVLEVREIFVYSWHCPACESDSTQSSMEQLKYLTCELCGQIYERTYKEFLNLRKREKSMRSGKKKENQENTEQSKTPPSS